MDVRARDLSAAAGILSILSLVACTRPSSSRRERGAGSAIGGAGVLPASQSIPEGGVATWSGAVTMVDATDGSPVSISWTIDDDSPVTQVVCDEGSGNPVPCTSWCTYRAFSGPETFAAAPSMEGVFLADLDGDSTLDLIAPAYGGTTSVLLGNGDGTYASPTTYTTGADAYGVATADFDGDAAVDIAVANRGAGTISLLSGLGDGTFNAKVDSPAALGARAPVAYDFDGDGDEDLAVVSSWNVVAILRGNGDGTFGTPVGAGAASVAAGDFDGDGILDLAVANQNADTVSVLHGRGDGRFSGRVDLPALDVPNVIRSADVNGDGALDLLVTTRNSDDLSVFLGVGDGTFVHASDTLAGSLPSSLDIADVNGDGNPDAIVGVSNVLFLLLGNGDGTFQSAVPVAGADGAVVDATDMNGDGIPDITAIGTYAPAPIRTFLGRGDGSFQDTHQLLIAAKGSAVAIGDLDGDGRGETVVADASVSKITVLAAGSNGLFQRTNYVVGANPLSVALADLNADGRGDVVTANYGANTVSVLLGTGGGVLGAKTDYPTGSGPTSVVIRDLNGDGKPDLAVADRISPTVSVLLGNGDGTFQARLEYASGTEPSGVAAGDLNGDGIPDLVVANRSSATVSVLLGAGDGTFGPKSDFLCGSTPIGVALGDLNLDGKLDVAVANYAPGGKVSVLLGTGTGALGAPTSTSAGTYPNGIEIADLTGDGKPDVIATAYGGVLEIFAGAGDGTISVSKSLPFFQPNGFALGDVDGDGLLDLGLVTNNAATAAILFGDGTGGFDLTSFEGGALAVGDFDGDGKPDVVAGDLPYAGPIAFFGGKGNGAFKRGVTSASGAGIGRLFTADIDADGAPDVVDLEANSNVVHVFRNLGDGTFQLEQDVPASPGGTSGAVIGDFDRDGMLDLAVTDAGTSVISILPGNGDATFRAHVARTGSSPGAIALTDFDGDGIPDLAVTNGSSNSVSIFHDNGDGSLGTRVDFGTGASPLAVAAADIDGDGTTDLATANYADNTVSILPGLGDGTFATRTDIPVALRPAGIVVGDVSGDSRPDLVVSHSTGAASLELLLADQGGGFRSTKTQDAPFSLTHVVAGDLNGDGHLDLAAVGGAATVAVFAGDVPVWECPVGASHQYFDSKGTGTGPNFDWHATLTANAATSGAAAFVETVTVDDVAPTMAVASGPGGALSEDVLEGTEASGYFQECDVGDTGPLPNDALTLHVDWGDGTTTTVPQASPSGCSAVTPLTHLFPNGGTYQVSGTATDDEGLASTPLEFTVHVLDSVPSISAVVSNSPIHLGQAGTVWIELSSPSGDAYTYDFAWDGDPAFTGPDDVVDSTSNVASFTRGTTGTVDVPVRVHDDDGNTVSGSVSVTWLPAAGSNRPPLAVGDTLSTQENTATTVTIPTLLANDSDPDTGDTITFAFATPANHGTVLVAGSALTYAPAANFFGTDSFSYTIVDSSGATGAALVTVNVAHVNQPPTVNADSLVTAENVALTVSASALAANDQDVDGDNLSVTAVGSPTNGMVVLSGGMVTFDPTHDFRGVGGFSYTVSDGSLTASGTVSVTILPVNHVPGTPGVVAPQAGAVVSTATPLLMISPATDEDGDPLEYEFEIDTSPAFDGPDLQTSTLVATTSFSPSPLTEDATWYWRARATDGNASGNWAMAHFLVNASNAAPTAPIPIAPVEAAVVDPALVAMRVLNATDIDGTTRTYVFTLRRNAPDGALVEVSPPVPETPGETEWTPTTVLKGGAHYFWHAHATDEVGADGPESPTETFVTSGGGGHGGCDVTQTEPPGAGPTAALLLAAWSLLIAFARWTRNFC